MPEKVKAPASWLYFSLLKKKNVFLGGSSYSKDTMYLISGKRKKSVLLCKGIFCQSKHIPFLPTSSHTWATRWQDEVTERPGKLWTAASSNSISFSYRMTLKEW